MEIIFPDFKKVKTLSESDDYGNVVKSYELTYGVDEQRRKSVFKENGTSKETRYYLGSYEEKTDHATGIIEKIHYLSDAVYITRSDGSSDFYYVYTDHLGSLTALTGERGDVTERYAYDPWGNRRDPYYWANADNRSLLRLNRDFTMHEHIDQFGIINMNGRVYDPLTSQFFSPDPYVQAPENWLNYNRYQYAFGNPLLYTDPTGEWFGIDDLVVGVAGFAFGYLSHGITTGNWGWSAVASGGIGAASAWLGYNTCGLSTVAWAPGQGVASATWNYVGSMAINTVANQVMPPMTVPLGNNFGLSISPAFGIGANGLQGGLSMNAIYDDGAFRLSAGIGAGDNYSAWNVSATYDGYGLGYGQTSYGDAVGPDKQSNAQTVGSAIALWKGGSFRIENDFLGDRHDRWRSNAVEISIGKFVLGTNLYNNDPKGSGSKVDYEGRDLRNNLNKWFRGMQYGAWEDGQTYSSPFWIGYKSRNTVTRVGYSHRYVQDRTQNWVHRNGFFYLPFGHQNFYNKYNEFTYRVYSYSGYYNPFSLW